MYERIEKYIEKLLNNSTPDAPLWNIESIKGGKSRIGIILTAV